MGLDMYLSVSRYVGDWNHTPPEERTTYQSIIKALGLPESTRCEGSPSMTVQIKVAYWRKANAVHNWFVVNVQGGKDECQEAYVSKEQLQKLVDICKEIKADNSKAEKLLPTKSGFFFGDTQYDEYFFQNIESTIEQLEKAISSFDEKEFTFYYQSSW